MIEMSIDIEWMVFLQNLAERVRDPLRQGYRDTRPDTDDLDVFNRPDSLENIIQSHISEHQRIAT